MERYQPHLVWPPHHPSIIRVPCHAGEDVLLTSSKTYSFCSQNLFRWDCHGEREGSDREEVGEPTTEWGANSNMQARPVLYTYAPERLSGSPASGAGVDSALYRTRRLPTTTRPIKQMTRLGSVCQVSSTSLLGQKVGCSLDPSGCEPGRPRISGRERRECINSLCLVCSRCLGPWVFLSLSRRLLSTPF